MPQLDTLTFFNQIFYFTFIFQGSYFVIGYFFIPIIYYNNVIAKGYLGKFISVNPYVFSFNKNVSLLGSALIKYFFFNRQVFFYISKHDVQTPTDKWINIIYHPYLKQIFFELSRFISDKQSQANTEMLSNQVFCFFVDGICGVLNSQKSLAVSQFCTRDRILPHMDGSYISFYDKHDLYRSTVQGIILIIELFSQKSYSDIQQDDEVKWARYKYKGYADAFGPMFKLDDESQIKILDVYYTLPTVNIYAKITGRRF